MKSRTILVIAFLCSCTAFHPQPISLSQTASDFESRTLASPELKKYIEHNLRKEISPWPPESWDFRMLALAAAYYSPALDVMRAKWGVSEAEVVTAGGRPNPSIFLLGQHHSNTAGGLSPWTWGLSLDIPIETAGKRGYRIRKARHLSEAARLNIASTAWQVWSNLKKSLLNFYATNEGEHFLVDQLAIEEKIVNLFQERLAVGESSQFELTQSRLALDKTRLLLSDNQKKKAKARGAVAEALGLQVNALDGIKMSFGLFKQTPDAIDIRDIRRQALLSRPDILAALSEYEAAQSDLQLEIAKQYPDFHLGPGYEWDQGDNKWSLGFSVALPVLNRNQGPIMEAEARRKEFAAKFVSLQAGVIGQIDTAQAAYNESIKNLQIADSLVSTEEQNMKAAESRFTSGEAGQLDLQQAKMQLAHAVLSRFDAFITLQTDLADLENTMQRPLAEGEIFPEMDDTQGAIK